MTICKRKLPLEIRPGFVLFLCAYYYFDPANSFYSFLMSGAIHETGHLLTLRLLGVGVRRLELGMNGAVIETEPLSYRQEFLVAGAGPLMNLLLAILLLHRLPLTALINLSLFVYNLLPIYPLDGGRILRSGLALCFCMETAAVIERCITFFCMALLALGSVYLTCISHLGLWPVLLTASLFLRLKGYQEWPRRRASRPRRQT